MCADFDDAYWAERDQRHEFPWAFYAAMAEGGWLGVAIPEEYGGGGRGITECAIVLNRVAASGAAMNGSSALHLTMFGLNPVVKYGNDRLKETFLPRAAVGDLHIAFGVTEPDAGTDTSRISTGAIDDGAGGFVVRGRKIWTSKALESEVCLLLARTDDADPDDPRRRFDGLSLFLVDLDPAFCDIAPIPKLGRNAVASCEVAYDDLPVEGWRLVGERGRGFQQILHGLNPERILLAAMACGIGEAALRRAVAYAEERIVFDRPIGANQAIAHPLAQAHMRLNAAGMTRREAAWRYDQDLGVASRRTRRSTSPPSRVLGGRPGDPDPRRSRLRVGVPRRAVLARGTVAAPRSGEPGDDLQLHRATGARTSPLVLSRTPLSTALLDRCRVGADDVTGSRGMRLRVSDTMTNDEHGQEVRA